MRGLQLSVQRPQGVQLTRVGVDGDGRIFVRDGVPVCGEGGGTGGWGKEHYSAVRAKKTKKQTKKELSWLLLGQNLLPDALFGLVGIAGCDGADVVHHALLLHGEVVSGLGEDRRLVHIKHPDDHLFVQMQNATVERGSLAASHGFSWFYVVMHRHQYQYWY